MIRKMTMSVLLITSIGFTQENYENGKKAYQAGRYQEAVTSLLKSLNSKREKDAPVTEIHLMLGNSYFLMDSLPQAEISLRTVILADTQNFFAFKLLGDLYSKRRNHPIASDFYKKAIDVNPKDLDVRYALAQSYYQQRLYEEALKTYKNLLRVDSTSAKASRAYFEIGQMYYLAKKPAEAAGAFQKYTVLAPKDFEGFHGLTRSLIAIRQWKMAIKSGEKAITLKSDDVDSPRLLARGYFELKNYTKVDTLLRKVFTVDTTNTEDAFLSAQTYVALKNEPEAIRAFKRGILLDPNRPKIEYIYSELGRLCYSQKRYDEAVQYYQKAIEKGPKLIAAYLNLGNTYLQLNPPNYIEAIRNFKMGITLKPDYIQAYKWLATTYAGADSLPQAYAAYDSVIKYNPKDAEAYQYQGYIHLRNKKFSQAIDKLKKSIQLDSKNFQSHLWLAQSLAFNRQRTDAIKEYKTVLQLDPKNKDAKKGLDLLEGN